MASVKTLKLRRITRILLFIIVGFLLINLIPQKDATPVNSFINTSEPAICAQSGSGSAYPKNVASAFTAASYMGVKTFSLGAVLSADNVLIVADTNELSTYTGENGLISEFTYQQLRNKNFANNFSPDGGVTFPYRGQNILCVKLETMFQYYYYSDFIIRIVQEGEEGVKAATYLCELIRKCDMLTRVVVKGSDEVIKCVREQTNVTVFTAASETQIRRFANMATLRLSNLCVSLPYQYVEIDISEINKYSAYVLEAFRNRNVCVYVSGVDTVEQYEEALKIKPDGIITTEPENLIPAK